VILRKVATRCQILRPKCTKFDFRCGSAPDPAGGAYIAPPGPLAVFKGPTSKGKVGKEGREEEGGEEGNGRGREQEGREGRGRQGRGGATPKYSGLEPPLGRPCPVTLSTGPRGHPVVITSASRRVRT